MEYIVGKTAGFCFGVKNAVESAKKNLEKEDSMCCLGEIVHNKEVINELKESGMEFIDELKENIQKKTTIIRAHGVSKDIYDEANKKNIKLVDLTCPYVLKIHKMVSEYSNNGYYIFLIGAKQHPETVGTAGFCGDNYSIIEDVDDLKCAINEFDTNRWKKIFVAVQTTFNLEKFIEFSNEIKSYFNQDGVDVEIANTICLATKERQEETSRISKNVDFMIIIGGKNSSNTKKLFEIAKNNCNDTICVETYEDVDTGLFKNKKIIGIMAGASTPQSSIDKVLDVVKNT